MLNSMVMKYADEMREAINNGKFNDLNRLIDEMVKTAKTEKDTIRLTESADELEHMAKAKRQEEEAKKAKERAIKLEASYNKKVEARSAKIGREIEKLRKLGLSDDALATTRKELENSIPMPKKPTLTKNQSKAVKKAVSENIAKPAVVKSEGKVQTVQIGKASTPYGVLTFETFKHTVTGEDVVVATFPEGHKVEDWAGCAEYMMRTFGMYWARNLRGVIGHNAFRGGKGVDVAKKLQKFNKVA